MSDNAAATLTTVLGLGVWAVALREIVRHCRAHAGPRAYGTVRSVRRSTGGRGGVSYSSIVGFVDHTGRPVQVELPGYQGTLGHDVLLCYPADRPDRARRAEGHQTLSFAAGGLIVGAGFLAFPLLIWSGQLHTSPHPSVPTGRTWTVNQGGAGSPR